MIRRVFCKLLLVAIVIFSLLALSSAVMAQGRSEEAFERVKEVQERHALKLMAKKGVVGTAIGLNDKGKHVVMVMLEKDGVPGIPQELEGVPVRPVVSGKFYAFVDPTDRFTRPVPTGVSTGHPDITAGTIACRVKDSVGNVYALSNNHVYADENNGNSALDSIPGVDNVLQPGPYDGGLDPGDKIGVLYDFEPIDFSGGNNVIDAAIALSSTTELDNSTPSDGYGTPESTTATASLFQSVQKYGRTTGLTSGTVVGINMTVNVGYSSGVARFVNQIVIAYGNFSKPGDSGSLVVTKPGKQPVGLLFAGSTYYTIANPIGAVLGAFDVTIDDGSEGPVDNPPVVDITNPTDGATVSGTIDVTADATDDNSVTQVEFFVDDGSIESIGVDTSAPYGVTWDSTTVADGLYIITATATDTTGQTASDSIIVVVFNVNSAPIVVITNPSNGATFDSGASIFFEGTASDAEDDDLASSLVWTSDKDGQIGTGGSFSKILSDGSHTITAEVNDSGSKTGSYSITITVGTPPEEPTTVSVDSITYATQGGKGGTKHLLIYVILVDNLGSPVSGASVSIQVNNDTGQSWMSTSTTGINGIAVFKLSNAPSGLYTTTVTNVSVAVLTWDEVALPDDYYKP
ncbi:Ig-like domain-containing protein [Planctomycetota bacterium]